MADVFEDSANAAAPAMPEGRGLQALERLAKLAAGLFDCATAVLLFNKDGVSRIVCGHNLAVHFLSYRWGYERAPYAPGERYIAANAEGRTDLHHAGTFLGNDGGSA